MDVTFEKIQLRNACVMGSLSKLWTLVEEARKSKKKQIPIDLDIRAYIEKTVFLLGQTNNYNNFFGRFNILVALNCPVQQSKEMSREEADLLQWHDRNLFCKKFSKHLVASAKSKKQAIEIFAEKVKKKQHPFRKTPSEAPRRSSGRQYSKFFLDKRYGKSRQKIFVGNYRPVTGRRSRVKVKINTKETFFNMLFPSIIPMEDLTNVHPWVKSLFFARTVPNLPRPGRLKHILEAWEILAKDPEIVEIVKGFKIPFLKNPKQERVPQTPHMGQKQGDLIQVETENMLKKGAIQQTEH